MRLKCAQLTNFRALISFRGSIRLVSEMHLERRFVEETAHLRYSVFAPPPTGAFEAETFGVVLTETSVCPEQKRTRQHLAATRLKD
jgi:hypothetical protein